LDASGNLWIFAGSAYDSNGVLGLTNDVWKFTPSNSQWAWIAGSNQAEHLDPQAGVYGTKGVGSTANSPGPRHVPVMWYDNSSGKLWMHGGWGYTKSTSPVTSYLGDLWSLDPSNLNWTWVNGPSDIGWDNTTGTLGVASATNFPGARYGAVTLRDGSGNLWLFGGYGVSPQGGLGDMSDLWKYNPTTSQWTWMSGPDYPDQAGVYGTKGTGSTNNYPGGRKFSIGWIDGSGIIWLFGGAGNDYVPNYGDLNDLWKFNPSNSQWTWVAGAKTVSVKGTYGTKGTGSTGNIPGGREKATAWIDSSGNFWLFGGYGWDGAATAVQGYLSDLWEFAPGTSQWTWVSGSKNANSYPTWGTKGVANTANIPGSRSDATSAVDSSGNFWIYSGYGLYSAGVDSNFGDLWKYDPAGGTWTWVSGFNTNSQNGTYGTKGVASTANVPGTRNVPRMVMDSSGKLWMFGGWGLDSAGSDGYLNDLWKYDPAGNTWTWMTGSNVIAQPGVYGNMGAASANNSPGARQYDNVWIDSSNNIWMYGGHGFDSTSTRGLLYDLWKYKP
jgi:N-acetylneuraminic acid mutarotase